MGGGYCSSMPTMYAVSACCLCLVATGFMIMFLVQKMRAEKKLKDCCPEKSEDDKKKKPKPSTGTDSSQPAKVVKSVEPPKANDKKDKKKDDKKKDKKDKKNDKKKNKKEKFFWY